MNKENNLTLIPKPSEALARTQPGRQRILSGMVSDTLALATNPRLPADFAAALVREWKGIDGALRKDAEAGDTRGCGTTSPRQPGNSGAGTAVTGVW